MLKKGQAMAKAKLTKRLPTQGAVVRAWREYCGLTSTELAEKAGVRLPYLSELENDRTVRAQEDFLEKLADALEVPLQDILGRRMPPKKARLVWRWGNGQQEECSQRPQGQGHSVQVLVLMQS